MRQYWFLLFLGVGLLVVQSAISVDAVQWGFNAVHCGGGNNPPSIMDYVRVMMGFPAPIVDARTGQACSSVGLSFSPDSIWAPIGATGIFVVAISATVVGVTLAVRQRNEPHELPDTKPA